MHREPLCRYHAKYHCMQLNICLTCYLLAKSSCDDTGKKNWENNTVIISKTGEKLLNHF